MLRLISQRTNININKNGPGEEDVRDDEISQDTQEGDSTHDEFDQDSSSSFDDADSTTSQEDDFKDWTDYIKEARKKLMRNC